MSYCRDCKHFKVKRIGSKGGKGGVCEQSNSDRYNWETVKITRPGSAPSCKKFERADNE